MSEWSYVFCDLLTGVKKATLPMYGVSFDQKLCDVGQFEGIVPTVDPDVRGQDPWGATEARKTALYVERNGAVVWAGIVQGVERDQDTWGLKITAYTFESWLARQYLLIDTDTRGLHLGAPSTFDQLLAANRGQPNFDIGLRVTSNVPPWTTSPPAFGASTGAGEHAVAGTYYQAAACKTYADQLKEWVSLWNVPIEWRCDAVKNPDGSYSKRLMITEGTLADGRPTVPLSWPAPPNGANGLLTFTDTRDGTTEANMMVGSVALKSDPAGTGPEFGMTDAGSTQINSDEFVNGYPIQMSSYTLGGTADGMTVLYAWLNDKLLDALVQGHYLSNVTLLADAVDLGSYAVGDAVDVAITHPSYREWPAAAGYDGFRILGRKVTVGSGTTPDTVSLDVVPPADRLPTSVHVTAAFRQMLARLTKLETGLH